MSSIAASSAGSSLSQGISLSGGISFAGLGSGTDFQTMIEQLKKGEEIPKKRLELWRADWQRRVDAFDELIAGISDLSKKLNSMDTMSTFLTKLVGSTNPTAVTAVASSNAPLGSYKINVTQLAANAMWTTQAPIVTDKNHSITTGSGTGSGPGGSYIFSYTYGDSSNNTRDLYIPAGTSAQSFINIINNDSRNLGVTASLIQSGNGYVFQLIGKDTGVSNDLTINPTTELALFDPATPNTWYNRPAQDAEFYLEGRQEQRLHSSSNALTEVIPGLTINLTNVTDDVDWNNPGPPPGYIETPRPVMLTVTNDATATKQKVMEFVEGVNELLAKFQELTRFDQSKNVLDPTRAASQFAAQKGSVLTGNYGVQLLNSRIRSMIVSTAKGFSPLQENGTGDVFWSLARIGITMDADESSKSFGQLVVKEGESEAGSPFQTLDEALAHNPQAVAELLAGDKIVRSNSPNFSYVGMLMKDMVKAGTHSVKIENVGGEVQVWIGGVQADYDLTTNEWTSKAEGSRGLVIRVDIPPANPGDSYESTLTVKQGKINELNELFKSELKGANQQIGAHTDEKGSLHILRENYLDIIKNIDKKIAQEETRLIQWETRMRMQFSRLDTLLSNYENLMTSNAAALASASTNYSNNK